MTNKTNVITYRYAWSNATVSLCAKHAKAHPTPLGSVVHGRHRGECSDCT